ncbi:MAG: hypothetical protein E6772_11435 [Dysgonomonas sp.]|nr:hypothetical protein [Dysgonomonas sp.]
MEFSFEMPSWLMPLIEEPGYLVMWAAFGVFLLILVLSLVFSMLGKLMFRAFFDKMVFITVTTLLATWLTGFVSMMIFLFTGVSSIKMLLIWITLFVGYLIFSIINRRGLERFALEFGGEKKSEK